MFSEGGGLGEDCMSASKTNEPDQTMSAERRLGALGSQQKGWISLNPGPNPESRLRGKSIDDDRHETNDSIPLRYRTRFHQVRS